MQAINKGKIFLLQSGYLASSVCKSNGGLYMVFFKKNNKLKWINQEHFSLKEELCSMLYPAAKVIVRNQDQKNMILLAQRTINNKQYYEPAGGRVDVDFCTRIIESFEECALREIQEELGVTVSLEGYLGSYYFFWEVDSQKASVCTVFEGVITQTDPHFVTNKDTSELPLSPSWVSMHDILNGSITIDPGYVGLEKLIKDYCHKNVMV